MWKTVVYSPNTGAEVISIENQHCLALVSTTDGAYKDTFITSAHYQRQSADVLSLSRYRVMDVNSRGCKNVH